MEKMRKILLCMFFVVVLSCIAVSAQTTNPWSASAGGVEKNIFSSLDDVFVKSNTLCEPAIEVDLYVVENKDDWQGGESLEDVRGSAQLVTLVNSKIPLSKVWSKPDAGDYDIIIDCNQNEGYDKFIDKIDSFSAIGFTVEAVAGAGKAKKGENDVGDHRWQYDPEKPNLINVMLQLSLFAEGEDIELKNITIKASGSGNDAKIDALGIYVDENNNGRLDEEEILIGEIQPAYIEDDGRIVLDLDYFLTKNLEENILVVYTMKEETAEGVFSLKVESLYGVGSDSSETIKFSGLPLDSGKKTVMPKKTCLGILSLELDPNPAIVKTKVIARMDNLSGCANKTIFLRKNPCGSSLKEDINSCKIKDGGCEVTITAMKSETLYVCIDKNSDGDMVDFGEFAFGDLVIAAEKIEEKAENVTEEVNVTKTEEELEEQEKVGKITGGILGLGEELTTVGSFFILLEVTLLLILFVLIMILFKLRTPVKSERSRKEEED